MGRHHRRGRWRGLRGRRVPGHRQGAVQGIVAQRRRIRRLAAGDCRNGSAVIADHGQAAVAVIGVGDGGLRGPGFGRQTIQCVVGEGDGDAGPRGPAQDIVVAIVGERCRRQVRIGGRLQPVEAVVSKGRGIGGGIGEGGPQAVGTVGILFQGRGLNTAY